MNDKHERPIRYCEFCGVSEARMPLTYITWCAGYVCSDCEREDDDEDDDDC